MARYILLLVSLVAVVTASPLDLNDTVVQKLDTDRYHYVRDGNGDSHLVDLWVKASDLQESARFDPDTYNQYHLFTRSNPSRSQPIVFGYAQSLWQSNFDAKRRTVIIIHGWNNSATSPVNAVLVPAFLEAEDVNVIVVDWNVGAVVKYVVAVLNTVTSGVSVARFLNWLSAAGGVRPDSFHIVGHSLGGHQSGIVGRNLYSPAAYITSMDPALPGWITNNNRFRATDGIYTEVIHTNSGVQGFLTPLGHVDFYPNGGINMPGCNDNGCDHARVYFYVAESVSRGGFTGRRCSTYMNALSGNCHLPDTLRMGAFNPSTGRTGIFYLETNAGPPFSRG